MPFVVDASIAACWLMPDESHPIADTAFERLKTDAGLVPAHWWFETRNVFLVAERRGRITAAKFGSILVLLGKLPITSRTALPLGTLDRKLVTAAKAEGIPLIGIDA